MFWIERLFGVACYLLVLCVSFSLIYYKKVKLKDTLLIYLAFLMIFSYFYEPYKTADLFRIRKMIEIFSMYDFESFYEEFLISSSSPVAYCLYWIVGCIGNVRILPVIVVLITYSITFYILYKSANIYSLNNKCTAIILLFVMSTGNYMMVISNIRTMLAISIICFCFFRESVMSVFKIWHIILYVFAALTHNMAIILIIVRIITFVSSTQLKKKNKILLIVLIMLLGSFGLYKFDWLLLDVYDKAVGYITGDTYSYVWEYVIGFIAFLIEIKAVILTKKNTELRLKESKTYLKLCMIIAFVFVFQFSIFQRLVTYIAPLLAIPVLAAGFSVPNLKNRQKNGILLLSLLMLTIACTRGELCSLKFFVL